MNPIADRPLHPSPARRAGAVAVLALIAATAAVGAYSWRDQLLSTNAPMPAPRPPSAENGAHAAAENGAHAAAESGAHAATESGAKPIPHTSHKPSTPLAPAPTGPVEQPKTINRAAGSAALKTALDARIQRLEFELRDSSSAGDTAQAARLRVFIGRLRNQVTAISAEAEPGSSAAQTSTL